MFKTENKKAVMSCIRKEPRQFCMGEANLFVKQPQDKFEIKSLATHLQPHIVSSATSWEDMPTSTWEQLIQDRMNILYFLIQKKHFSNNIISLYLYAFLAKSA
jgi:hypothetical protein